VKTYTECRAYIRVCDTFIFRKLKKLTSIVIISERVRKLSAINKA
jgi:hypothetical protein